MTSISPSKKNLSPTVLRMRSAAPAPPLDYSFMGLKNLSGNNKKIRLF
jgi:hypothetical protein